MDRDLPEAGILIRRPAALRAWLAAYAAATATTAPFARLSKAPKHRLADPGLAAYLMGVSEDILTSGDTGTQEVFGQLFQSLLLLTLRGSAPLCEAHVYHFRTSNGEDEVDVILERFDAKCIAFEAKSSAEVTADDVKHLNWLEGKLCDRLLDKVLVYTGKHAYRRPDGVAVIPLAMLG